MFTQRTPGTNIPLTSRKCFLHLYSGENTTIAYLCYVSWVDARKGDLTGTPPALKPHISTDTCPVWLNKGHDLNIYDRFACSRYRHCRVLVFNCGHWGCPTASLNRTNQCVRHEGTRTQYRSFQLHLLIWSWLFHPVANVHSHKTKLTCAYIFQGRYGINNHT